MLFTLPIEVWMDILDWFISHRKKVALKFSQIGIGDRQFSAVIQHWLHKCTKNIQIGRLLIASNKKALQFISRKEGSMLQIKDGIKSKKQPKARLYRENSTINQMVRLPFAEVQMPDNINRIEKLTIDFLDYNVIQFIRNMGSLFSKFRMRITLMSYIPFLAQTMLINFLFPHLIEIQTLTITGGRVPHLLLFIRDQFAAKLSTANFLRLDMHQYDGEMDVTTNEWATFIPGWLCDEQRAADAEPRVFVLEVMEFNCLDQLVDNIREQFHLSTNPTSFFARFSAHWPGHGHFYNIQDMTTVNAKTKQQLIIRRTEGNVLLTEHPIDNLLIGRCPSNIDGRKWLEEMTEKVENEMCDCDRDENKRRIELGLESVGRMVPALGRGPDPDVKCRDNIWGKKKRKLEVEGSFGKNENDSDLVKEVSAIVCQEQSGSSSSKKRRLT